MAGTMVVHLELTDGRPRVGDSDVPLEVFFDGMRRVVFVDDRRDLDRLGPGDLAVALGSTAGKTLTGVRRLGARLSKLGVVGLLVHERALTSSEGSAAQGEFPVVVIDQDIDWADVLQPLVRIDVAARGPRLDSEARRAALVKDILVSNGRINVDAETMSESGLDMSTPMRALYVAPIGELTHVVRSRVEEAVGFELLEHDPRGTVVAVSSGIMALETEANLARRDRLATSLLMRARAILALQDVLVGVGTYRGGVQGIFRSFREARWAAEVGYCLEGANNVTEFESLGAYAWLEPIDFERGAEATQAIETIMERDKDQGTRLLETLRAFLETRRLKEAADRLFIHRNTLRYRLDAIRKLTGFDPQDPEARLVLELQLRLALVRGLVGRGAMPVTTAGGLEVKTPTPVIDLNSAAIDLSAN